MANTFVITGNNTTSFGTALNKNQTDDFFNSGSGNTIIGIGGNINVTGLNTTDPTEPGTDTNTTIELTVGTHVTPPITGVKDTFTLDGKMNTLNNTTPTPTPITNSTINFTVLGTGGGNAVDLTDVTTSKITVAIGVNGNAGGNNVDISNVDGTNSVSIGGTMNFVTLNGEAKNTVTFTTAGGNTAHIGSPPVPGDDDLFGNTSTVTFTGGGNTLFGGDENFTVTDPSTAGGNKVHLGDGNNVVTLGGNNNTVSVWGGNNNINAGGSGATVTILGLDGNNTATPTDTDPGAPDDAPPVPLSPTDNVTIAGTGDSVTATYENVDVMGTGVTGPATIMLGDGNNEVVLGDNALGNSAGGSTVKVGDGANTINVTGNGSTIDVGDGANGVTLSGNNNHVTVTDPTGVGLDKVKLGTGTGDVVALDHAGGSVTGTGTGTTTVTQTGPNAVTVSLGNGTGLITLGDGKDTVTANGNGTHVTAGNGNDTVTANGNTDIIKLGNGNNKVTANGNTDMISLGNGNNTVTANGNTDMISLGNGNNTVTANGNTDTFTFGDGSNKLTANGNGDKGTFASAVNPGGSNTLVAKGSGDTWTFFEQSSSLVTATLGDHDTLTQTGGALSASLLGDNDAVTETNVGLPGGANGSKINANGNNETLDVTNSGGNINLNPSSMGDMLTINGVSNDYAGKLQIADLTGADPTVDLEDLYNTSGVHINSDAIFLSSLTKNGTGETLHLQGGGSIQFVATNSFDLGNFKFS